MTLVKDKIKFLPFLITLVLGLLLIFGPAAAQKNHGISAPVKTIQAKTVQAERFSDLIQAFSKENDRRTGTRGANRTAKQIISQFKALGFSDIQTHAFPVPARRQTRVQIQINGTSHRIEPFLSNVISPDTIPKGKIKGNLVYVGQGELKEFNFKTVKDNLVLMDLNSGDNWINALSLGAGALIYLYDKEPDRFLFQDKIELSPVNFPRFILAKAKAEELFPGIFKHPEQQVMTSLESDLKWTQVQGQNIYSLIKGTDPAFENELIIVEAFYDTAGYVAGKSKGSDQACSIASLMDLAAYLKDNPPTRPILLAATAGQGNSLAGMREMVWALDIKAKEINNRVSRYQQTIKETRQTIEWIQKFGKSPLIPREGLLQVKNSIRESIRTRIESQSNRLMKLRLDKRPDVKQIKSIATRRMAFKRLEGRADFTELTPEEKNMLDELIPQTLAMLEKRLTNALVRNQELTDAKNFRALVGNRQIQTIVSLHLSSHGDGIGAFNQGWLYDIKKGINPFPPYAKLNEILNEAGKNAAQKIGETNIFKETLRPSLHQSWQSHISDHPALGGEVSRLAGFLGVSLVSLNDSRQFWNTPGDTSEKMDILNATRQSRFLSTMILALSKAPSPIVSRMPRNGFAELTATASFLRQGAIFADAPAPGSIIFSFQGPAVYIQMADEEGNFNIKGITTKKMSLHKIILEGYKFDPVSGQTIWAVDKKKTSKERYRVKVDRKKMETDLTMFPCRQTTLVNLLEPRTFRFLTKLQVLDARMDAAPIRYWYSRIDTRSSLINSIYLPSGSRLKLAFSDTHLTRKIILTHSGKAHASGNGYRVDDTPLIAPTQYLAAKDMWSLINPRIQNLEKKGINNEKIRGLQSRGNEALVLAQAAFDTQRYDLFFKHAGDALAMAGRVYLHVDTIQKDVLYGVLFYIMLFAPFAFCLERLIFAFINIYKRIGGFTGILVILITIIYQVHPAFELAYSPIVIILSFFILGLSAIVTWILFARFENEMKELQHRGRQGNEGEITLFKAFAASFFMGINNLRRRRIRTGLTCTTLIILTFTIMSFTSVKNIRQYSRLLYNESVPYQGMVVKQMNWQTLPPKAVEIIENAVAGGENPMTAAPRGWLESETPTQSVKIPVGFKEASLTAQGLVGLSPREDKISPLAGQLASGRWFNEKDRYSIIIPKAMADLLNLPDPFSGEVSIRLWSIPFKVIGIFDGGRFDQFRDLDGEPISPVIFPNEVFQEITEVEMEALESGDDIKGFQSRYSHIPFDQTLIIPYSTLISLGGHLKSVALKSQKGEKGNLSAIRILDRFGLWLFSGEPEGVFVYGSGDSLKYSGLPNIWVPVIISIFIVLNTMVGSVQERKREIGIYTSIGMAPSHVSVIFIAEALAYGVLSVVLGYLCAQVTAKLFAGTALLSGLTINYSSLGGVFAMALVMMVVLLSAIYPSRVAASIAIPDVEKSWELAKNQGDLLDIDLPFLIKTDEERSLCGFLCGMFDDHRGVSHGIFSVGRLSYFAPGKQHSGAQQSGKQIQFTAWLAPFDLGVMQMVEVMVIPSQNFKGYLEIKMVIRRKSGEQNTWWRINRRFVNLIRKQLLIWRAMDEKDKILSETGLESVTHVKGEADIG